MHDLQELLQAQDCAVLFFIESRNSKERARLIQDPTVCRQPTSQALRRGQHVLRSPGQLTEELGQVLRRSRHTPALLDAWLTVVGGIWAGCARTDLPARNDASTVRVLPQDMAYGRLMASRVASQTPVLEAQPAVWWLQTLAARSYSHFRDGNA